MLTGERVVPIGHAPPRCERCVSDAEVEMNIAGEYPVRLCRACRRGLVVAMCGWDEHAASMAANNFMQALVTHGSAWEAAMSKPDQVMLLASQAICKTRLVLFAKLESWLKNRP